MNAPVGFDFRRINWGMGELEVMAAESVEPKRVLPAVIMYDREIYGLPMTLMYQFAREHGRTICVAAVIQPCFQARNFYVKRPRTEGQPTGASQALDDYEQVRKRLVQELGEPTVPDIAYRDQEMMDELKQQPDILEQRDISFLTGELAEAEHSEEEMLSLMRHTEWSSVRTDTSLALAPVPFGGAMLCVRHRSRAHLHLFQRDPS